MARVSTPRLRLPRQQQVRVLTPAQAKRALMRLAGRLSAALDLPKFDQASDCATLDHVQSLRKWRQTFAGTVFTFDADTMTFTDATTGLVVQLFGCDVHSTKNRFTTFVVELFLYP